MGNGFFSNKVAFFFYFLIIRICQNIKKFEKWKNWLIFEFMINWQILILKIPMKMLKKKIKKNSEKMAFFQIGLPFFAIFELSESAKISKNLKSEKMFFFSNRVAIFCYF